MLYVRNPTGVSHSPLEHAETSDCLAGVEALTHVVQRLAAVTSWWCEQAWLDDAPVAGVRVHAEAGVITAVERGVVAEPGDERLTGLVLPGFANAHSHAFHRAMRGRTHDEGGTFWTWRERMYQVAGQLDPDSYLALARATYAEMALAGVTCVGEFHYLHHGPGGTPYDDPNAMSQALRQAACDAGIRITLLDACYLAGGLTPEGHTRPDAVQQRFSDGTVGRWASRVGDLRPDDGLRVGAAIHSVRAVPKIELGEVAAAFPDAPLHAHLSEQVGREHVGVRVLRAVAVRADGRGGRARPAQHHGARDRRAAHGAARQHRAPRCASARPPSATWPTASARPG